MKNIFTGASQHVFTGVSVYIKQINLFINLYPTCTPDKEEVTKGFYCKYEFDHC